MSTYQISIQSNYLLYSEKLGKLKVLYKDHEFFVININTNETHKVSRMDLDNSLRGISKESLIKLLKIAKLRISKIGNDFAIRIDSGLLGGGPVAGAVGYLLTKGICYGTAAAAVGTVVVTTGGVAGAALGAGAAIGGSAVTAVSGAALTTTVVGGAIAGAGLSTEAALVTAAAVTGPAGIAGAIAAVEGTSLWVGSILTACPFLP